MKFVYSVIRGCLSPCLSTQDQDNDIYEYLAQSRIICASAAQTDFWCLGKQVFNIAFAVSHTQVKMLSKKTSHQKHAHVDQP